MLTTQDAAKIAAALVACPHVEGVELFGSVARTGEGSDLDLILLVPQFIFARFICAKRDEAQRDSGSYAAKDTSFIMDSAMGFDDDGGEFYDLSHGDDFHDNAISDKCLRLLTETFGPFADSFFHELEGESVGKLDIFCFPSDWKQHLDRLQQLLPHKDPKFMQNLAADAKVFDPITQSFVHA